ncbi:MAG: DUF5320 domain-containing protein [Anaerolineae bacterium]|nr:DUF5320 domain-containing protein [Anaerolineae bacterium]
MPGFDGTGPRGAGPLTGRGEGFCVMRLPKPGSQELPHGFMGIQGTPFYLMPPGPIWVFPPAIVPGNSPAPRRGRWGRLSNLFSWYRW